MDTWLFANIYVGSGGLEKVRSELSLDRSGDIDERLAFGERGWGGERADETVRPAGAAIPSGDPLSTMACSKESAQRPAMCSRMRPSGDHSAPLYEVPGGPGLLGMVGAGDGGQNPLGVTETDDAGILPGPLMRVDRSQLEDQMASEIIRAAVLWELWTLRNERSCELPCPPVNENRMQSQIDDVAAGLRIITNLVKGKEKVKEEKTEKPEKLMGDAMKSLTVETKKPEEKKPVEKKGEPSSPPKSPNETKDHTTQPEKPKRKEKVNMKLPFTFCNKKDENLFLWIAEIQTYCSMAPVERDSQVAFSTSCLGGEAKEWVLAEANAAGFDDIGEWVETLNLKQFLGKIKERFLDKTTADKAFDQLTTIGQKHWTSVESLSQEVDRLLQVPRLNLVLYIYSRALPEPIRGQLVVESKLGKYNYRQFRDLALQREQMTSQVKNSYASVVKYGGGAGKGKQILWRQKRQDHTLVVFDDDTVEKWPLEAEGVASSSDSGKGEVTAAVVNRGGPRPPVKKKRPHSFPKRLGIATGKPWEKMGLSQETWQERMDNAQCLKCGTAGHVIAWWRIGADVRKVHFAEEWNEMHHLKIMESLGGDELWFDRFMGQHAAFVYYWVMALCPCPPCPPHTLHMLAVALANHLYDCNEPRS
ncbi:hypothetical protein CBR_g12320 [Chara braunii]|uniref:Retrotransposon gag domain-containing protein n=1 Tax=Chara braunii TaxID=69332 RepID=A0A388KRV9_CHABU|nr:hypothetical protein CBR_g12320 [Chara braunii]|eukprot:GBG72752.1 hypothetical protein CBR_g12320 [Chara braunii]